MKKIYTLIVMVLLAAVTYGQVQMPTTNNGYVIKSTKAIDPSKFSGKATIDTAGWTINYIPQFASPDAQVSLVGMLDSYTGLQNGYWFGTSGDMSTDSIEPDLWAQCWINGANITVSGILFFAGGKTQLSSGTGSDLVVGVMKMMPYVANSHGCIITTTPTFGPSPVTPYLGQATVNIADFDTNFVNFNWAPFTSLATISGTDFCAVADFKAMRVAGDTAYMFCDVANDGQGMNYTMYTMASAGYYWISTYLSGGNPTLDVNMSIFAVIDDGAGINDEGYFQGMKMTVRNNPSTYITYVDYVLQTGGQTELFVYDAAGREVALVNDGFRTGGDVHTITINTEDFEKGNYFLSLSSGGGRFTKQLVVE